MNKHQYKKQITKLDLQGTKHSSDQNILQNNL